MSQIHGDQLQKNSVRLGGQDSRVIPEGDLYMGTFGIKSDREPVDDNDFINYGFLKDYASTSGGSSEPIQVKYNSGNDSGTDFFPNVQVFNFRGDTVLLRQGNSGNIVDIFIPPPVYAPYFNTGSATVASYSTISRNVSAPDTDDNPFSIGAWTAGNNVPTVYSSNLSAGTNITYSTPAKFNLYDLTTQFTVKLIETQTLTADIEHTHTLTIDSNKSATVNGITITISGLEADSDRYKCLVSISINLPSIISEGGRFDVQLIHDNLSEGTHTKTQNSLFYDTNPINPTIDGSVAIQESTPVIGYNSGVMFYDDNSQFQVDITDINNINNRSYALDYQIRIRGEEYNLPQLTAIESALTGYTGKYSDASISYQKTNWTMTSDNFFSITETANIRSNTKDYTVFSDVNSSNSAIIIDTYKSNATRLNEDFDRETRRLNSDLATPWDSTQNINTYGGNNGLQIIGSRLIYPLDKDFGVFKPNAVSQPDYTSATIGSIDRVYYSEFHSSNIAITSSNGVFTFSTNITESDISNGYFKLEISPDGSQWLDCTVSYGGGGLNDGDGCRVLSVDLDSDSQIEFTLGDGTGTVPGYTDKMYFRITFTSNLRSTLFSTAKYIGNLSISGGNWVL